MEALRGQKNICCKTIALLADGLQRIDRWTYVIQDWNEALGILEVSLFAPPLDTS